MKQIILPAARWAVTVIVVSIAIAVAVILWRRYEQVPWTRDGHVRADVVRVASDVGGLVTSVAVHDNQFVRKGQLLYVVDQPRYRDELDRSTAAIESARTTWEQARRVAARDLALGDLVATETHEENRAKVDTARSALDSAVAASQTAQLNVRRTYVTASVNGFVTNLDLHPGDFLGAGSQAMALVDEDSLRIEGYFEETKLRHIHVGDTARIRLMGEDGVLVGRVDSIAGGIADDESTTSANQLRAVDPTFTWVRLAQRIPVRIHVPAMPEGTRLIPGRTATVSIVEPGAA